MQVKVPDARIEQESRRVRAAFDVEEWIDFEAGEVWHYTGRHGNRQLDWQINTHTKALTLISIAEKGQHLTLAYFSPYLGVKLGGNDVLMARGLYRLGFETEIASSRLPQLLPEEKTELRFSFPREFWPQSWLDEMQETK